MMGIRKNQRTRAFLIILFISFVMFEMNTTYGSAEEMETVSGQGTFTMCSVGSDQVCPVRIPEKVSIQETVAQNWENWNKQEGRMLVYLLLFCLALAFLLSLEEGSRFFSEHLTLPHFRLLKYIHRKDGKGPKKTS